MWNSLRLLLLVACLLPSVQAEEAPFQQAQQLRLRGNYAEAAELYEQAFEQHPVESAIGLSRCQLRRGQSEDAKRILQESLKEQPKSADLWAELAAFAFDHGDWTQAESAVENSLKLDPQQIKARWVEFQLLRDGGKLQQAEQSLDWFFDHYNRTQQFKDAEDIYLIGLAAAEYSRWKRANQQFNFLVNDLPNHQLEVNPNYWRAHYQAGRLFAEKFNEAEANRAYQKALTLNPNAAEVYAAIAELSVKKFDWEPGQKLIRRALEINPQLLLAHQLRADVQIANFQLAEAAEYLEQHALPLNPKSEETLGRIAACYLVLDNSDAPDSRFAKLVAQVEKRNPHCGLFYYTLAQVLDTRRRFPDAIRYYQLASERFGQLIGPQAAQGLLYLRMGEEAAGRELLAASFEADPFHVRVHNMLQVLDVLEEYETLETEHFRIRYAGLKDKILAKYVGKYLEQQYPELCEQFDFQVPEKSLFEIFSHAKNTNGHGWFSARMTGLPYLGTVGACAGKMVAVASPNESSYNWSRVMKHEFIHVINLQQTHFNLPHWFAEGIAVMNEGYPRPQIWNQLLLERVPKGEIFTLDDINLGFIRPKSGIDWQMAYCQSELYVEYMLQRFGSDAIAKMLSAYEQHLTTPEAIPAAFEVSVADFEAGYREYLTSVLQTLQATQPKEKLSPQELQQQLAQEPKNPKLLAQAARQQLAAKQYPAAREYAETAIEIDPKQPLAHYVLARVYLVIGDQDRAIELLERGFNRQQPHRDIVYLLALLRMQQKEYPEATEFFELGSRIEPYNPLWLKGLTRIYLLSNQEEKLLESLKQLAQLDADDFKIRKKLAQLHLQREEYELALHWGYEALYVDVLDPEVHQWIAQAAEALERLPIAVEEYEVLVALFPQDPQASLKLAKLYQQAKQPKRAREELERLLQIHPDIEEAVQMWKQLAQ